MILYLARRDIARACRELDPVEAVASALAAHARCETVLPAEAYLAWTPAGGGSARSLALAGVVDGVAGTKVINANPDNIEAGHPRASGLTLLFDRETARPVAILEAGYLSALRTAAVSALAVELLAVSAPRRLALIGAGELAAAHIRLLTERVSSLRELRVFDVRRERATALADAIPRVTVWASAEEAIREADVVIPVTTTTSGYIRWDWLTPGTLVVNVSLDDVLPEVVKRADRVIVDDWELVRSDSRRLLGRMARDGSLAGVDAELGEIVIGTKPRRERDEEVILVNPFGLAIEDVALAKRVYEVALTQGLGVLLER